MKRLLYLVSLICCIALFFLSCSKPGDRPTENLSGTTCSAITTTCGNTNNLANIPSAYLAALTKYTTVNSTYTINVCTEDSNGDGSADYMVVESSNRPEHKSYYWQATNAFYEAFDFATNIHKYAATVLTTGYTGTPHSAGTNMIMEQCITMKVRDRVMKLPKNFSPSINVPVTHKGLGYITITLILCA